jgi:hypothetical protein
MFEQKVYVPVFVEYLYRLEHEGTAFLQPVVTFYETYIDLFSRIKEVQYGTAPQRILTTQKFQEQPSAGNINGKSLLKFVRIA